MDYEWDARKASINLREHGVAFETVHDFDWEQVQQAGDPRWRYGERRVVAYAPIAGRLHCLVYTMRGDVCRVISLRRTNRREIHNYEQAKID